MKEAWESIPEELVAKSFLKCGISNAMDGTEDHVLYEEFVGGQAENEESDEENDKSEDELNDFYDDYEATDADMRTLFEEESEEEFLCFSESDL